ncbi:hypothetical protein Tco_1412555, partial [Tanacetum coccineum]
MSDYEDSTVTYTAVSSPFGGLSDIGSLGVVGPEHEGLPWMLDDPYVQVEHVYPEFMPPEDEILLAEEKLLLAADSPTADSPGYIPESNPEEDPEKDGDEDPEEDPVDYPADGGDDRDDKDGPFDDDEDDKVDIEADDEEEEEHPTPAYFIAVALPAIDQALFAEETEPFETDESAATPPPHSAYHVTAMISILAPVPTPVWSDAEIPSPPLPPILSPLPVSPLLPQISSPPRLISSPVPVLSLSPPASPISPLGYRAAMIRLRAKATSTFYSLPLLPPIILSHTRLDAPSSGTPPMHLLFTNRRADRSEVTLPPWKRLGITLGPRYEVRESSSAAAARPAGGLRADYGFVTAWIGRSGFKTRVRQDTGEIYMRLEDEQTERQLLVEVMSLRITVLAQQSEIKELQSADRKRQTVITEMLAVDHKRNARLNPETTPAATAATTTTVTNAQLQPMIDQGVTSVLAARNANTNGDNNHNSGTERATRECTYPDFMKCEPLNFKGTEGVVELTQWVEKMETVFRIRNYSVENQIKFSTCTLMGNALTWWNSH